MKPILFITDLAVGGMQRVCVTLCNEWTAQGRAFLLYVSYPDGEMTELIRAQEQIHVANSPARFALIKLACLCRKHAESPLLVINAELGVLLIMLKILGLISNRIIFRESTAVHTHCSLFWKFCYRWLLTHADGFIVQSPDIAQDLMELFHQTDNVEMRNRKPIAVIRNPSGFVNQPSPDMFMRRNLQAIQFLMVGRLVELKGHVRVLEALNKVQSLDWHLTFVGDGACKDKIAQTIQRLGMSSRVELHGGCVEVRPYYERSDIVIMASAYEGLPSVVIEAVACGCRVMVAENDGGTGEFMRSLGLGAFIFTGDAFDSHFEECVQQVMYSDCMVWEAAYKKMVGRVHPKVVADQIWKFLEELC